MKVVFFLTLLVSVTLAANIREFMDVDEADEQAPGPAEPMIKTGKFFLCLLKYQQRTHSLIVNHYSLDLVAQSRWCSS